MKKEKPQNYHHGDLRSALIEAAVEMINKQGVEQVTMRGLSEWVGVSRTAAYRHFNDKVDLLTATAIEGFRQFSSALRATRVDDSVEALIRFRNMGKAYIQFAVTKPAYYRLMFGDVVMQDSDALIIVSAEAFSELVMMLQALQQMTLIKTEDLQMQATFVWSLMHGLASLLIDKKLTFEQEDMAAFMEFLDQKISAALID